MANMAAPKQNMTRLAPVRARDRNSRSGTSGWSASAGLDEHEGAEQDQGDGPGDQRRRRGPRHLVGVHDGVHQRQQAGGDRDGPEHVEAAAGPLGPRLHQEQPGEEEQDDPDGHVDEEDPAPRQVLGQEPPEQGTGGPAPGGHRAPHAEGPGPGPLLGEGDGQDGQGGRGQHGGTDPLQRPGRDQGRLVLGEAADEAGAGEQDQTEEEDAAPPEEVGQPSPEQQEAAEGERVGGHHPLEVGGAEAQVSSGWRAGPR